MLIKRILDILLANSNSNTTIKVKQNSKLMRPFDVLLIIGDCSKLQTLGWKPEIEIDKTLADVLDHVRL